MDTLTREDTMKLEGTQFPHKVVFFGMLSYHILSQHRSEAAANKALTKVHAKIDAAHARGEKYPQKSYTRDACKDDYDVRTQDDLDALTDAILSTYR
jgi:hypothetical protein